MYFIKIIYKAKAENSAYKGEICSDIWGKRGWIEHIGSHATATGTEKKFSIEDARKYGFKTIREAKNNFFYKMQQSDHEKKYWEEWKYIIEINLDEMGETK